MTIVTKKMFLQLPVGTLFSYYDPCIFQGLMVKQHNVSMTVSDFYYIDLIANFTSMSIDFTDCCQDMEKGLNIPISCELLRREGLHDDNLLYAVYNDDDVKKIIGLLQKSISEKE